MKPGLTEEAPILLISCGSFCSTQQHRKLYRKLETKGTMGMKPPELIFK